jgi:accessory gene regulator protein AgrB
MMVCSSAIVKFESSLYAPVYRREAPLVKSGSEENFKRKKRRITAAAEVK